MLQLTATERRALRARAHHLHPVVTMGEAGLTPAVLHEIDGALKSHELVKIRAAGEDRHQREALMDRICGALDAAPVQQIGRVLVVFRRRPDTVAPAQPSAARKRKVARRTKRSHQM